MIVATTQFSLQKISTENEFWARIKTLINSAKAKKADLIVFPEYFSLSAILANHSNGFREVLVKEKKFEARFIDQLQKISTSKKICIIAGTNPNIAANKKILNRSWIFRPGKKPIFQDKVNMTRFESEEWHIAPGQSEVKIFKYLDVKCAVAICYDIEFPSYSAALAKEGVEVILVPSCTDDIHGYWRVRHCAEARAVENQAYVVMSSIVGGNQNFEEISSHEGKGVILSPCDIGFSEAGIVCEGNKNSEGIAVAKLNLPLLRKTRKNGTVLNLADSKKRLPVSPKLL